MRITDSFWLLQEKIFAKDTILLLLILIDKILMFLKIFILKRLNEKNQKYFLTIFIIFFVYWFIIKIFCIFFIICTQNFESIKTNGYGWGGKGSNNGFNKCNSYITIL